MQVTQYPEIDIFLEELLTEIKSILSDKLVGLYLYGFLVWGDFDYEISDIDLLAAISSELNEEEFNKPKEMQDNLIKKYPKWENRLEVAGAETFAVNMSVIQTIKMRNQPLIPTLHELLLKSALGNTK